MGGALSGLVNDVARFALSAATEVDVGRDQVSCLAASDGCRLLQRPAARNSGQRTIGKFRHLSASVCCRKSRVQRVAYDDFFQLIPLIATPYNGHM